ncbi:MAG: type II toxin-antitoxin system Phd/YefM family antitoxin [Candidatus Competibacteraceae bacterium]
MQIVNVYEAKTHLSRLLEQVAAGEEIVIAKAGKPLARLIPYEEQETPREPGYWRGRVRIADDFDELPESIAAAFRGEAP